MKQSAQNLFRLAQTAHEEIYKLQTILQQEVSKCNSLTELADYAFAIDRSHELIEDCKKQLWKFREEINKKVCTLYMEQYINNPSKAGPIKTDHVTATPDIKTAPKIPKAGSPEWKQLIDFLNIPDFGMSEKSNGEKPLEVVRLHWPDLIEHLTNLDSQGKPPPPGINPASKTLVYKLTLRKKKEVLD